MNDYMERHALYKMLAQIKQKKIRTVKTWFYRNKKNVTDAIDFLSYIK